MSNIQIPNLPAVASLAGQELFEGVQAGTSVKISLNQIVAAARAGTPVTLPLGIDVGGTGATTAPDARTNLGLGTISTQNANSVAITGGSITGITDLAIADGGTGASTAPDARTNLGLGTIATQNANNVTITGGSITGITDLAVADGGTGVSTLTGYVKGNGTAAFTASATVPSSDITGLGTMSTQNANNVTITGGSISGITDLAVADGGTGFSTYDVGDILYASATSTFSKLSDVATGNALISGGVGASPSYGKIGLTTHVNGVLPVDNGGTGVITAPAEAARILGYTSTATVAGTTTLTNASSQYQLFTGSTTQIITLPVTSTLVAGWSFHIVNNSTGNLTVNSSGGNLVVTVISGLSAMVTCIGTTLTTAADWEAGLTDFQSVTGTGANVLADGATMTNGAFNGTVGASTPATGVFTTLSDAAGNVRDIVNNPKVAAYILAATDNGEMINITTGGVTVNSGIFSAGNNVTVYNNSAASQTVTQGAGVTLRLAGSATTGNRTLAQRGICTIVCVASNEFVVSGAGVT